MEITPSDQKSVLGVFPARSAGFGFRGLTLGGWLARWQFFFLFCLSQGFFGREPQKENPTLPKVDRAGVPEEREEGTSPYSKERKTVKISSLISIIKA